MAKLILMACINNNNILLYRALIYAVCLREGLFCHNMAFYRGRCRVRGRERGAKRGVNAIGAE